MFVAAFRVVLVYTWNASCQSELLNEERKCTTYLLRRTDAGVIDVSELKIMSPQSDDDCYANK